MKAKTIKKTIRAKIDDWLESIDDEALRNQVSKNVIVTGGAIASMLLREKVNDFDIYLRDRQTTIDLARYYVERFKPILRNGIECEIRVDETKPDRVGVFIKSAGVASEDGSSRPYEYFEMRADGDAAGEYLDDVMAKVSGNAGDTHDLQEETEALAQQTEDDGKPRYRPVFMSTNAISLSHRIQLVTRFYGDPAEIHENYDFSHCTNYWTSWDDELVLRSEALECLLTRELRYVGSKYPLCSLIRVRKFVGRGWTVNAGQILKMVMQLSDLDLKNPEVLQDQLTGVDAAYFCELMAKVKEKDPDKINMAYLVEIIDRLF